MLHLSLLQLVDEIYSKPIRGTHFNLVYTFQESKKLIKYGYVKSVCFCNNYVEEISLKKLSKSFHNKSMSEVDVEVVNVNLMFQQVGIS
jgi:hypothetical protein